MTFRHWLPVFGLLLPACGPSPGPGATTTRDSAGVRIVESSAPRWAGEGGWQVDPEPLLDLSRRSGREYEFFRVGHAVRFRDGRIAVANRGSSEVRVYSASGEFLRSLGRDGDGPGEFRRLTSVHEAADSVLAFDYWQRRITIFSLDGAGTRTIDLPQIDATIWRIALLSDGQVIGSRYDFDNITGPGLYRVLYVIFRLDLADLHAETIAQVSGAEGFQFEHGDARPLFQRDGFFAVHGDRVYLGDGDSLEIEVRDNGGRVERIMRVPGYDLRITAAELATERDALVPPASAPAELREVVSKMPDRATRPAYSNLLVDAAGNVWLPEYLSIAERDRPLRCNVLSPEGEWLGTVALPARFAPYQIGADYVLGLRRDEADVERVQLLRLTRTQ